MGCCFEKERKQQPAIGRPYFNDGNSVLLPSVHSEENQNLISHKDKKSFLIATLTTKK